jgi:hypothetical protein
MDLGKDTLMKTTASSAVAAVVAALALFVSANAMAQYGGMGSNRRGMRMDRGTAPQPKRQEESVATLVDYRLALLQEDLKLTRDQESGWVAYEERMKALAGDIMRERERAQSAALASAIEQVNHAADSARNRLTAWEDIAAATKSFYGTLTPQQKLLIDQRLPSIVHELSGVPVPGDPGPRSMAPPNEK